jgi:hypothetical protein
MFFFGKSFLGSKLGAVAQTKQSIFQAKSEVAHKFGKIASHLKSALPDHSGHHHGGHFGKDWGHNSKNDRDDDCDDGGKGGLFGGLKSLVSAKVGKLGSLFQHGFGHVGWGKGGHQHGKDDCDPRDDDRDNDKDDDKDDPKDDDNANDGGAGGNPGGASGVSIPADTSGITFHVDEDDDGNVNAYMYIQAEEGVDPATVNFDDYLVRLKDQLAENHPDLDPSTAVIKATIYSPSEGESYYYFNGTEFEAVEDAQYYEEFAANFGTIPDDEPAAEEEEDEDPDMDC